MGEEVVFFLLLNATNTLYSIKDEIGAAGQTQKTLPALTLHCIWI